MRRSLRERRTTEPEYTNFNRDPFGTMRATTQRRRGTSEPPSDDVFTTDTEEPATDRQTTKLTAGQSLVNGSNRAPPEGFRTVDRQDYRDEGGDSQDYRGLQGDQQDYRALPEDQQDYRGLPGDQQLAATEELLGKKFQRVSF